MKRSAKKIAALAMATLTVTACAMKSEDKSEPAKAKPTTPSTPDPVTPNPVAPAPAPVVPNTTDVTMTGTLALGFGLAETCDTGYEIYGVTFNKKDPKAASISVGADCAYSGDLAGFANEPSGFFVRLKGETICSVTFEGKDAALTAVKKAGSAQRAFAAGNLKLNIKLNKTLKTCVGDIEEGAEAEYTSHVFAVGDLEGAWGVHPMASNDFVYDAGDDAEFGIAQKEASEAKVDEFGEVVYSEDGASSNEDDPSAIPAPASDDYVEPYFSDSWYLSEVWTDGQLTQVKKYSLSAYQQCFATDEAGKASFVPLFVTSTTHDDGAVPGEIYDISDALVSATDYSSFLSTVLGNEMGVASNGEIDNATFETRLTAFVDAELVLLKGGATAEDLAGAPADEILKGYLTSQLLSSLRGMGYNYSEYSYTEDGTEVLADYCVDSAGWYEVGSRPMSDRFLCENLMSLVPDQKGASKAFLAAMRSGLEASCDVGAGVEIVTAGYGESDAADEPSAVYTDLAILCGGQSCYDPDGKFAGYVPGHAGDFDVIAGPTGHFSLASYSSSKSSIDGVYDVGTDIGYREDGDEVGSGDDGFALNEADSFVGSGYCYSESTYSDDWSYLTDDIGTVIRSAAYVLSSSSYYDECGEIFDKPQYDEEYAGDKGMDEDLGAPAFDEDVSSMALTQDIEAEPPVYEGGDGSGDGSGDGYAYDEKYSNANLWAAIWVRIDQVVTGEPEYNSEVPVDVTN